MDLFNDAQKIIKDSISSALPGKRVRELLFQADFGHGKIVVIAVGKAALSMATAAHDILLSRIHSGLIVTKEGGKVGHVPNMNIIYGGHPYPNEHSVEAVDAALELVRDLEPEDHVLFLLSGGASALFEKPFIPLEDYNECMDRLLTGGASITEINTVRKHLSMVKGGRFAELCAPATVDTIILSDVIGNDLTMVGSGPTLPDKTVGQDAFQVLQRYHIKINADILSVLSKETPKTLKNATLQMAGDVHTLLGTAKKTAENLGYQTVLLSNSLDCEAREAGAFIASIARTFSDTESPIAFLMGGESVVHVKGNGLGGRNQEMALACAIGMRDLPNVCFFSVGSDGNDGPTDAAGGIVTGETFNKMKKAGLNPLQVLDDNDSYHGLKKVGSLVMTGMTGTNVNDLQVLLIGGKA